MTRQFVPVLGALLLAACNQPSETVPANGVDAEPLPGSEMGNAAEGNATNAVLALNDRQRNAVFIRAILDAGLKCEAVTASERIADMNGQPTWRAHCGPNDAHIISIAADGTATINSRSD
jgi:hypothetical protein